MNKKTWITAVCMLLPLFLAAQGKYESAYIINPSGDTIRGEILNRDLVKSPASIEFRKVENGVNTTYTPADIREFSVRGNRYASIVIPDPSLPALAASAAGPKKPVFLRVIVEGRKALYYYTDETLQGQFYIREDTVYTRLLYSESVQSGELFDNTTKDQRYKGQLILYLQDCPAIKPKINDVIYSEHDLKRLFADYYECMTGEKSSYLSTRQKAAFDVGLLGGWAFTHLKFEPVGPYHQITPVADATYDNSSNYSAGVYAELTFPKNHGKWSIFTEGIYSPLAITGTYTQTSTLPSSYTDYVIHISVDQIQMNFGLRYKFFTGKFDVFGDAGISYTLNVNAVTYADRTQYYSGTPHVFPKIDPAVPIKNTEEALFVGAGVKYWRLYFETRYRYGDGITAKGDEISTATSTYQLNFMLGIRLF